jgi:hypothetical protein
MPAFPGTGRARLDIPGLLLFAHRWTPDRASLPRDPPDST